MPKAARERTVSFRARAPHSLRFREYPRPKASLDEQASPLVTERGTDVKENVSAIVTGRSFHTPHVRHRVTVDYRWVDGQNNRLSGMAADLVRRQVAVMSANQATGPRWNMRYSSNGLVACLQDQLG
jgi:hypothetical protein